VLEIHPSGKYTGETREYLAGAGKGTYSVADIGAWRKVFILRNWFVDGPDEVAAWVSGYDFSDQISEAEMNGFPIC
jgi:glutathione S-transferase